jgi:hypothetical protein
MSYASSCAVDKANSDQSVSGTSPVVVTASNVLWDFNGDFDTSTYDFIVPVDGIYSFDVQMRMGAMINVTSAELAIYKRGEPDEFWFTMGKLYPNIVDTQLHFGAATRFNFFEGERYCLKVTLSGILPSANILGDDTLTSWGFNYETDLTGT